MIKLNQLRTFLSKESRDEYNSNAEDKDVVFINPQYIVALERITVGLDSTWPSCWTATRITTTKGTWNVEGGVNRTEEIVSHANR
jgi:hypothetical protein